jgi:spoIIIJ-associated protein
MSSDHIEMEGKTVDEAIEKACREFGVPREKLSIDILSEGSSGFLGIGSKKAKIVAGLLNLPAAENVSLGLGPLENQEKREPLSSRKGISAQLEVRSGTLREVPERRQEKSRAAKTAIAGAPPVSPPPETVDRLEPAVDEKAAEKARDLLEGLLERMSIPSPVTVEETEETIVLNIEGDGEGRLIGKRGQHLDALQHIVNQAVNRQASGRKMIVVDTEAYRKRWEESLVTLAERLGQKVKKTRKTVTVSNMNAHDRRIIHLALQGDTALTTRSRGGGVPEDHHHARPKGSGVGPGPTSGDDGLNNLFPMDLDTIAAIATPQGMGGIAVIRVSGPLSETIAGLLFRLLNLWRPSRAITFITEISLPRNWGGPSTRDWSASCAVPAHTQGRMSWRSMDMAASSFQPPFLPRF